MAGEEVALAAAADAEWLDVGTAAHYMSLSASTIYRLINEGRLQALRFPARVRRHDLDGLIERCRIKPGELAHLVPYRSGGSGRTCSHSGK